jgi:hypothetical protein
MHIYIFIYYIPRSPDLLEATYFIHFREDGQWSDTDLVTTIIDIDVTRKDVDNARKIKARPTWL